PATAAVVRAALQLADGVDILVAGSNCRAVAEAAARLEGVSGVLLADHACYEQQLAEAVAPLVVGRAGDYTTLLAAAGTAGKNLMPRVAALLDVAQVSEITAVVDATTFVRPVYAGAALATVQVSDAKRVVTVRSSAFEAVASGDNAGAIA